MDLREVALTLYGSTGHMEQLAKNLIILGNDLYMDLCLHDEASQIIHVIARESGVYLALQMLQFYFEYGKIFQNHFREFVNTWCNFIVRESIPTSLPTQARHFFSHISFIAIEQHLP